MLDSQPEPYEVVFVDDGSTDASRAVLERLHAETTNVIVIHLRRNFGKAAALQAGFLEARGDVVVTMDADLQDDPAEIPQLLAKLDEGFDLVSGWKSRRNDPWTRRSFARVQPATAVAPGVRLHDVNCGLKAYKAEVLRGMRIYGELHRFIPVLASYRGFRVAEIPVNHRARQHGRSRYGPDRYLRGFFDLLSVTFMGRYSHRPLHLFGGVGFSWASLSLVLLYLTVIKLGGAAIGHRPLLTLGVLLVVVGIQLLPLGAVLGAHLRPSIEEWMDEHARAQQVVEEVLRARSLTSATSSARLATRLTSTAGRIRSRAGCSTASSTRSTPPSESRHRPRSSTSAAARAS